MLFATDVKDPVKNPVEFPSDANKLIPDTPTLACQLLALFAILSARFTTKALVVLFVLPTYFNFNVPYSEELKEGDLLTYDPAVTLGNVFSGQSKPV